MCASHGQTPRGLPGNTKGNLSKRLPHQKPGDTGRKRLDIGPSNTEAGMGGPPEEAFPSLWKFRWRAPDFPHTQRHHQQITTGTRRKDLSSPTPTRSTPAGAWSGSQWAGKKWTGKKRKCYHDIGRDSAFSCQPKLDFLLPRPPQWG